MACAVGKQCLVRVISQARFLFIQAVISAGETLKKRMQKYKLLFALVSWPTLVQICFFNCVNLTVEGICACGRSCPTFVVAGGRRASPLLPPPTILSLLLRILQNASRKSHHWLTENFDNAFLSFVLSHHRQKLIIRRWSFSRQNFFEKHARFLLSRRDQCWLLQIQRYWRLRIKRTCSSASSKVFRAVKWISSDSKRSQRQSRSISTPARRSATTSQDVDVPRQ